MLNKFIFVALCASVAIFVALAGHLYINAFAEGDNSTSTSTKNSDANLSADSSGSDASNASINSETTNSSDNQASSSNVTLADDTSTDSSTNESSSDDYGDDMNEVTIHTRVLIDGVWKYASKDGTLYDSASDTGYTPITVTKQAYREGGNRAIIPQAALEKALTLVGFSGDELVRNDNQTADWGNWIFGYCDYDVTSDSNDAIWNNVTANKPSGYDSWYVFTKGYQWINEGTDNKILNVYYLPANRDDGLFTKPSSFFSGGSASRSDATRIADNTFHSVTVEDDSHLIYAEGETLPSTQYIITTAADNKKTATVKAPSSTTKWKVWEDADGDGTYETLLSAANYSVKKSDDGTTSTYTFSNITGPVKLVAAARDSKYSIAYKVPMTTEDLVVYGSLTKSNQSLPSVDNDTIDGEATKVVEFDAASGNYKILAPDEDQVTVTANLSAARRYCYKFEGWTIVGDTTSTVYSAGATLTADELESLADEDGNLVFKSSWSLTDEQGRINTANFFLDLECEVQDNTGSGYRSYSSGNWSPSIYSSRLSGTDGLGVASSGDTVQLNESSTAENWPGVDKWIRSLGNSPVTPDKNVTGVDYTGEGITIVDFPTDEEIFAQLRSQKTAITIDGNLVSTEDLNANNFTVRWNLIKYVGSDSYGSADGWHVDGVLVAKRANVIVSKTFAGESEAIDAVKGSYTDVSGFDETADFYISVKHTDSTTSAETEDYKLLLIPDSSIDHTTTTGNYLGYFSYDSTSGKYTWDTDARQGVEYTYVEKNSAYSPTDSSYKWNNSRWYSVKNTNSSQDTNGWIAYDFSEEGNVNVTAKAYAADTPTSARQTVSFRNMYVHAGTLIVSKTSTDTSEAMAGVQFKVTGTNDEGTGTLPLYQKIGTNLYTTDTHAADYPDVYTRVDDYVATTDSTGFFYIELAVGSETSTSVGKYVLTEQSSSTPGYTGAETITFSIKEESGITGDVVTTSSDTGTVWAKANDDNAFELDIFNRPDATTNVFAVKNWDENAKNKKQVTVELWREYGEGESKVTEKVPDTRDADGNVSTTYTQTLTTDNNWMHEFTDLPLVVNNQYVRYFLKETWIGDPNDSSSVHYDPTADPSDGYKNYVVSGDDAAYVKSDTTIDLTGLTLDEIKALFPKETSHWTDEGATSETYANNTLLVINNEEVGHDITFKKVDREGVDAHALKGATFTLYSDEDCTDVIGTSESDANGTVRFSKLSAGTYYFKETSAPHGYAFSDTDVYKTVIAGESVKITKVGDDSGNLVTSIVNKYGAALKIFKVGSGTKGLYNAQFRVTKDVVVDETTTEVDFATVSTSADGIAWVTGVEHGTYHVYEIKAPNGYQMPDADKVEFSFTVETNEEGQTTVTHDEVSEDGTYTAWAQISSETTSNSDVFQLTAKNTVMYTMPTAGGIGVVWVYAAGIILLCGALTLTLLRANGRLNLAEVKLCAEAIRKKVGWF
ncbi:MAG: SpaA isopeptide-forming pilin-related protein [Phoenicibacter congonensis]|uniref:SpaA isopeptide-forming pilin-related protein n=1 Tax=Phoenicibacter congonensis TaxID=1944646 RepID=A0AA43U5Q2_9ACTN|nr:SpaA isopeptide-forming pilin-related protein [Phoenicibacter congonensis]